MDFQEMVLKNRSYRRFDERYRITSETLYELVALVRISASSGNIQGLKFYFSSDPLKNDLIFPALKWAYYLRDWDGPVPGERPSAYLLILGDTELHKTIEVDVGIAAQTILLGAASKGLGGCMIGSVDRLLLRKRLAIPARFDIPLVIALGKPIEHVVIDPIGENGSIEYWRDHEMVHHVPKRNLEELVILSF